MSEHNELKTNAAVVIFNRNHRGYYQDNPQGFVQDLYDAYVTDIRNGNTYMFRHLLNNRDKINITSDHLKVLKALYNQLSRGRWFAPSWEKIVSDLLDYTIQIKKKLQEEEATESAPIKAEPVPAKAEPAPVKTEPAPVKAEPTPVKAEPAPVKAEPAPVKAEPAPVKAEPAPVVSTENADNELEQLRATNAALLGKLAEMQQEMEALKAEKEEAVRAAEESYAEAQERIAQFEQVEMPQMLQHNWDNLRAEKEEELALELALQKKQVQAELEKDAEARASRLVQEKLSDYLQDGREDWLDAQAKLSENHQKLATVISHTKEDACDQASRMQREMKEYMDNYMVTFCANMDQWRKSLYDIQLEEFAKWYARFSGFVDRLDARILAGASGEGIDEVIKVAKSLKNLRNSLERVLPSMGLQSFYPREGELFDSAFHVCGEDDPEDETTITRCINPGVTLLATNEELNRVLVKAEVEIAE